MPTPKRYREDYDPEPDYERPTKAEAQAEMVPVPMPPAPPVGVAVAGPDLCGATDAELAARLRRAADRVVNSRPDLAALINEAAHRLSGDPF